MVDIPDPAETHYRFTLRGESYPPGTNFSRFMNNNALVVCGPNDVGTAEEAAKKALGGFVMLIGNKTLGLPGEGIRWIGWFSVGDAWHIVQWPGYVVVNIPVRQDAMNRRVSIHQFELDNGYLLDAGDGPNFWLHDETFDNVEAAIEANPNINPVSIRGGWDFVQRSVRFFNGLKGPNA